MKTYSLYAFAASLLVMCSAGFSQTPAEIDSHIAGAKAAAGLDFPRYVCQSLPARRCAGRSARRRTAWRGWTRGGRRAGHTR